MFVWLLSLASYEVAKQGSSICLCDRSTDQPIAVVRSVRDGGEHG